MARKYMKIAMVGQKRVPSHDGGIEVVVGELAKRMVAQGHSVTWCMCTRKGRRCSAGCRS